MAKISDSFEVHKLDDLQLKGLWVLDKLSDSKDRLSSVEIADYLIEECGISTSRQAITYALEKEGGIVHKNKGGYKLMEAGRKKLAAGNSNSVIVIESGKPFSTKNVIVKDIFNNLKSPVLISDPYLDINTLDLLFKNLDKKKQTKILTHKIADKPSGTFSRHLGELRQEGFQIEIGVYSNSDLHDRYIMDDNSFWLSGNSLNYIGNKESFIVRLGEDIRQSMLATFNNRWKIANKI
ncbi:MAG TPA: hypothetical protein VI981_02605 [Candidatus Paceibacterota bacterium]